ncbi:CDP-alcohol phosphatidyltransferase family protein [Candidatus Uhrbacteria bacterium]|nr:CDP-alcohol phosphatidyltransferase family protein [Candidatus Uhrbacteria bacterium]
MAYQTAYQRFSDAIVNTIFLRFIPRSVRPNAITSIRVLMTPVVYIAVARESYGAAIALFIIASLTDLVDGAMARTRDQITRLGKILDPIADKVLITSLMIPLVARSLSVHIAIVILVMEVVTVSAGLYRIYRYHVELQANWWGKIKFTFQAFATVALLLSITATIPQLSTLAMFLYAMGIVFGFFSLATHGF